MYIVLECQKIFLKEINSTCEQITCSEIQTPTNLQVTQLTGFSDPVYAEAYVHVNQYDIVLDILVVNQTNDTLQNVTLELATLGKFADLTDMVVI